MGITVLCSTLYMWRAKTEHFPFGMPEVRPLLIARGLTGFFGVFGMYYSLLYLPLADATVITFLAPSLACWACSYLINEPFTKMEQIAAYVSLFGVVLIARPISLFSSFSHANDVPPDAGNADLLPAPTNITSPSLASNYDDVTPTQRATAVGVAMLGVLGATGAYTTLRWIGKRAHPLISVNYFATWCTVVSVVMMFVLPGVGFLMPTGLRDWSFLIFLGVCGFIMVRTYFQRLAPYSDSHLPPHTLRFRPAQYSTSRFNTYLPLSFRLFQLSQHHTTYQTTSNSPQQFLLAAGLQYEKSSRATNMVYTQMLFALAADKLVWGTTPSALSILGSSLILGSAIYVAMHKTAPSAKEGERGRGSGGGRGDAEAAQGLLSPAMLAEVGVGEEGLDVQLQTLR